MKRVYLLTCIPRRDTRTVGAEVSIVVMGNKDGIGMWIVAGIGTSQLGEGLLGRGVPEEACRRVRHEVVQAGRRSLVHHKEGLVRVVGRRRLRRDPVQKLVGRGGVRKSVGRASGTLWHFGHCSRDGVFPSRRRSMHDIGGYRRVDFWKMAWLHCGRQIDNKNETTCVKKRLRTVGAGEEQTLRKERIKKGGIFLNRQKKFFHVLLPFKTQQDRHHLVQMSPWGQV